MKGQAAEARPGDRRIQVMPGGRDFRVVGGITDLRATEASRRAQGLRSGQLPTNAGRTGIYPFLPGLGPAAVDRVGLQPSHSPYRRLFSRSGAQGSLRRPNR